MNDIVTRLRIDAGRLTLAALVQEREAAACEIERLQIELVKLNAVRAQPLNTAPRKPATAAHPIVTTTSGHTLLRLSDVCAAVAVSRSTIYKRVAEGTFPAPVRISERSVRWRSEDLEAWRTSIDVTAGASRPGAISSSIGSRRIPGRR
jgi:prophage regulatory protein